MKHFRQSDVDVAGKFPRIYIADYPADLKEARLWWQKRGLRYTASGYGSRIPSEYKINFNGRLYRLYQTIYANAGSVWFKTKGGKIFVS